MKKEERNARLRVKIIKYESDIVDCKFFQDNDYDQVGGSLSGKYIFKDGDLLVTKISR